MRGFVDRSRSCPRCPACGGLHYPATTGAGARVWCDGSSADALSDRLREERSREGRAFRAALRAALRAEHERRSRSGRAPLEPWERDSAPDTLPDEI